MPPVERSCVGAGSFPSITRHPLVAKVDKLFPAFRCQVRKGCARLCIRDRTLRCEELPLLAPRTERMFRFVPSVLCDAISVETEFMVRRWVACLVDTRKVCYWSHTGVGSNIILDFKSEFTRALSYF